MDDILGTLFDELCQRIKDCKEKNPLIDMDDIERSCILIQSYINKPLSVEEEPKEDPPSLPDMSYEELCKLTRPPRITPKGHLGPAYTMVRYAEKEDTRRARMVDDVIRHGKQLDKNKDKPFF
jgi:hypothetical protein